jgi:hypothetical protein
LGGGVILLVIPVIPEFPVSSFQNENNLTLKVKFLEFLYKNKESELQSLLNELFSQTDLLERLFDPEKQREEPASSTSLTACHLCGSITHDKDNISSENKNGVSKPTLSPPMVNYIISLILLPISAWIVLCWLTH